MPVYEYECRACNRVFEVEQRISDPVLSRCPECQGPVQRLITAGGGFVIKNSRGAVRGNHPHHPSSCSFTETGSTCCGREERCDKPPCGSGR
jgi:putative FmdB family regulatory protein